MSKKEQDALVAFFNTFKLSKRIAAFDQLADGKALMEVMSTIDATHFKQTASRNVGGSTGSSSNENWVLKMNTLKRLYRLLLTFPLPSPNPSSLSLSSLPEPPFSVIAQSPTTSEGSSGLIQLCRLCLSVGVWASGNEKVIMKIQGLGEGNMAELMRAIEGVMETLPAKDKEDGDVQASPIFRPDMSPLRASIRSERDKLLQENDELRNRCEQMMIQVAEISTNLDEVKGERDEALVRLNRVDPSAGSASLRNSQTETSEIESLRADLVRAEATLEQTEGDLERQLVIVADLTKHVDELKVKAGEANKLKDQLDEYRHAAEKLQKSENVIEKYKKKLEDSAGLRRELRSLEEENSTLVNTNASLEAELKKTGASKTLVENYKSQIETLAKKTHDQASQITDLTLQLETTRAKLADIELAHERDLEQLELNQEKVKEMELGAPGLKRAGSRGTLIDAAETLGDEMCETEDGETRTETKTSLKLRVRALQCELADAKSATAEGHKVVALETLLADANKARDRYQADYLEAHRSSLRLQANLEQIRSGRGGDYAQTSAALRQRLNEVIEERDSSLKENQKAVVAREAVEKDLQAAKVDLSLVDKDQQQQIATLRESIASEAKDLEVQVSDLKDQISGLKDKDRLHLEEIKKLLLEKVDLQSSGINQREKALEREKEFSDIRASFTTNGTPKEAQQQILDLHQRNDDLSTEVKNLEEKWQKAKAFIRDQDALFRAEHADATGGNFDEASRSYENQITTLKADLQKAKQNAFTMERRYKLEQQLMLTAWHELGARTVRDHIGVAGTRRYVQKPVATSWLGRQRKHQEDALFVGQIPV